MPNTSKYSIFILLSVVFQVALMHYVSALEHLLLNLTLSTSICPLSSVSVNPVHIVFGGACLLKGDEGPSSQETSSVLTN